MTYRKYRTLRRARIIVSLVLMLALTAALAAGRDSLLSRWQIVPALMASALLWIVLWVAVTLLLGRVYCSGICPLGTLQDMFIAVSRRRRRGFFYRTGRPAVRVAIAAVALGALLLGMGRVVEALDPAAAYRRMVECLGRPLVRGTAVAAGGAVMAALVLGAVAVCSLARGRLICNTVCPVGTLLGALSRYSLYHMDIDTDRCIGCGECVRRCKAECIDPSAHTVDVTRCVVCFDCAAACPASALRYRRGRHRLQMPLPVLPAAQAAVKAAVAKPLAKSAALYSARGVSRASDGTESSQAE